MDKIEKIRQEIDRRLNILTSVYAEQVERKDEEMMNYYHGKVIALGELRPFLDTMQEPSVKDDGIDFEQELYNRFGMVKDFTLGMRIAQCFYELGKNAK